VVAVTDYTVRAKRWARGWELHIDGVGVTQSHSLADAPAMATSYITMMTGTEPQRLMIVPEVGDGVDDEARQARAAVEAAATAQREAAAKSRKVAQRLRGLGLTGRDIAAVLGVSQQRVSQLLKRG
jgi:DNA-directed RNA polymerase specialized sigma subunit